MEIQNNDFANKVKQILEGIGHQNVNVWFEEKDEEKDYQGGWVFTSCAVIDNTEYNYFDTLGNDTDAILSNLEEYRISN